MTQNSVDTETVYQRICTLIEPFNRKGVPLTPQTTFAGDLDLDSLTVMDLVAAIEDEFDIVLPINRLPNLETIQQVAEEVAAIVRAR
ncbi:MAG: acyl carrier protein [Rhodothalassiaceae bacterium]